MATEHPESNATANPGYERRDASPSGLLKFGAGLFLIPVVCMLGMKWMFFFFAKVQKLGPPASPFENARVLPPEPRLQVQPKVDLERYRESETQILTTYGWVDKQNGVVRLPIDRAMDLLLERGLPARSLGEAAVADRRAPSAPSAESAKQP